LWIETETESKITECEVNRNWNSNYFVK